MFWFHSPAMLHQMKMLFMKLQYINAVEYCVEIIIYKKKRKLFQYFELHATKSSTNCELFILINEFCHACNEY